MHTYMHACIHTYSHACMHTFIHTCLHTYIHAYIHTHIHTYIHTARFPYGVPVKQLSAQAVYFLEPKYGVAMLSSKHPPSGERELFLYYRASVLMFRCCSLLIPYKLFIQIMHMYIPIGHIGLIESFGQGPHNSWSLALQCPLVDAFVPFPLADCDSSG